MDRHLEKEGKLVLSGCLIINDKREVLLLKRKDHNHYETPGGKVRLAEISKEITINDLSKTAERETYEELGRDIFLDKLVYFEKIEFKIPDGRNAIANKFLTKVIHGVPQVNEPERFSEIKWIPMERLNEEPISPDLKLLLPKIKEKLLKNKK
jgi:8-oxo-dGTP pyrophosphatase MutT (NUDIX family)